MVRRLTVLLAASLLALGLAAPPAGAADPVTFGDYLGHGDCDFSCAGFYELDGTFVIEGIAIEGSALLEYRGSDMVSIWPATLTAERFTGDCFVHEQYNRAVLYVPTTTRQVDCEVWIDGNTSWSYALSFHLVDKPTPLEENTDPAYTNEGWMVSKDLSVAE